MKPVIRLGDPTSHGGYVTSAAATTTLFGKQVACVGDAVSCPKPGHSNCTIAEGDPGWLVGGRPVALDGHKASCGAVLISTLAAVMRGHETGASVAIAAATEPKPPAAQAFATSSDELEYYFVAEGEDGHVVNLAYRIDADGQKLHEGMLNAGGETRALPMDQDADAIFWIPQP